ncbi:MAG: hypothetical protein FJX47_12195 [Alphaproteobacteria bacterium]|nr:hypothetical protein [Alphaproteobacteria bacterium]
MSALLDRLKGGDRRSIGAANAVATDVLADPRLFGALFAGLDSPDPIIRMRAIDAVEKVSAQRPDLLAPHARALLGPIARRPESGIRWHVAQMIPRLDLSARQRAHAFTLLTGYFQDRSGIVRTFALQAMQDLAAKDPRLAAMARRFLLRAIEDGTPALKARARKLLKAKP